MQTVAYKVGKGKNQKLVLIESTGPGNVPRNASRKVVAKAAIELEQHIEPITTLAESIRKKLQELNNPGKIAIEFGVELGVEGGIPLITGASAKGNFKVTLEWENTKTVE
ncbi:MAG: hypothetical protein HS117_18080 [Verrucomicrobiaceae bacterium]|nr:hypothetical protein [Verrucomicrobiaceae bacterium]